MAKGVAFALLAIPTAALGQAIHLRLTYENLDETSGKRDGCAGQDLPGSPINLLFIGDSICTGIGTTLPAPLQEACAESMARHLGAPIVWRTVATTGADVRELHAKFLEDRRLHGEKFDVAIVFCGVNDGKKLLQGRFPSIFRQDLEELCKTVLEQEPGCRVAVPCIPGYLYAPSMQLWPMRHLVDVFFRKFEAQKLSVVRQYGLNSPSPRDEELENLFTQVERPLWAGDGLHPSKEGYHLMGNWLGTALSHI